MLESWRQKRKTEKEVNRYFREIVKVYKEDFDKQITLYRNRKSEKERTKRIQDNIFFAHVDIVVAVLMILALLFVFLSNVNVWFFLGYVVIAAIALIIVFSYQKMINEEKVRNKEIKELRAGCWKRAIEKKAKNYSCDRYLRYLVAYHKNRPVKRLIVALVSITFTVITIYIFREIEVKDVTSLAAASIVNIVSNYFVNKVLAEWSEDYYFELLKNDMLLY